jgi:aminopeptidase
MTLIDTATGHLRNVLDIVFEHGPQHAAVVVYDLRCELAQALHAAYRNNLPDARFIDFDAVEPAEVLAAFSGLLPSSLVVLVQSTNFRLDGFRLRVELFKRELKVIEHVHLSRMPGAQAGHYIESLAYDSSYYRGVGRALKARIDNAPGAVVDSGDGALLVFDSKLESAKLNIGDYSDMNNVGGQFPIGEVFTEAVNLEACVRRHALPGQPARHADHPGHRQGPRGGR